MDALGWHITMRMVDEVVLAATPAEFRHVSRCGWEAPLAGTQPHELADAAASAVCRGRLSDVDPQWVRAGGGGAVGPRTGTSVGWSESVGPPSTEPSSRRRSRG